MDGVRAFDGDLGLEPYDGFNPGLMDDIASGGQRTRLSGSGPSGRNSLDKSLGIWPSVSEGFR